MANTQVCDMEGHTYIGSQLNTGLGNEVTHLLDRLMK